jgi:hypothetical protein
MYVYRDVPWKVSKYVLEVARNLNTDKREYLGLSRKRRTLNKTLHGKIFDGDPMSVKISMVASRTATFNSYPQLFCLCRLPSSIINISFVFHDNDNDLFGLSSESQSFNYSFLNLKCSTPILNPQIPVHLMYNSIKILKVQSFKLREDTLIYTH